MKQEKEDRHDGSRIKIKTAESLLKIQDILGLADAHLLLVPIFSYDFESLSTIRKRQIIN